MARIRRNSLETTWVPPPDAGRDEVAGPKIHRERQAAERSQSRELLKIKAGSIVRVTWTFVSGKKMHRSGSLIRMDRWAADPSVIIATVLTDDGFLRVDAARVTRIKT